MRREDFQYDVFVSYASEDEGFLNEHLIPQLEGRLGLKLCLHERDFHPGKEIMANITDNLEVSRRAMLIFSTEFARSRWCQFELTLCMTHVMDNADVMLVVCLGELPNVELTTNMEAVLRTSTYLQWSNDPHAMARFWRRLESALRAP
nr:hypothetical protein BaRGS_019638 [Batillaria attramentaria]KAG5707034.1 hypothetical protein BaRGS_019639 [Batillaria attramentaria]